MKTNKKKKAFTLTELLVVVIIIGVLSAVVLPKFNKIIETRKTTEAEELMSAVRTEQEKRCALDKDYLTEISQLTEVLPSSETKNFTYSLSSTGIIASSKGKYAYQLQMPSYADGRICCENETECLKLNKDYPLCAELTSKADYDKGTACAGETSVKECTGVKPATNESCGNCGSRTRTVTCNTTTGTWDVGGWSACSGEGVCSVGETEQGSCSLGQTGVKTRTCTSSCAWSAWDTSSCQDTCSISNDEDRHCEDPQGSYTERGTWNNSNCTCSCPSGSSLNQDGECFVGRCPSLTATQKREFAQHCEQPQDDDAVVGVWNNSSCTCTCPPGSTLSSDGHCMTAGGGSSGSAYGWEFVSTDYCYNCAGCPTKTASCSSASDVGNTKYGNCYDDSDTGPYPDKTGYIWSWTVYECVEK